MNELLLSKTCVPDLVEASEHETPIAYRAWCERYGAIRDEDRVRIAARLAQLRYQPRISLVMPLVSASADLLRCAIVSVRRQLYPNWELCIADATDGDGYLDPSSPRRVLEEFAEEGRIIVVYRTGDAALASGFALELASGDFVAFMRDVDELQEAALYMIVEELNQHPDADILYSDEDRIDANGVKHHPHFKSDWNPDLLYGYDYIGDLTAYRTSLVKEVGGLRLAFDAEQIYDLRLRVMERSVAERIRHLPFVLYHSRSSLSPAGARSRRGQADGAVRQALLEHFFRSGEPLVDIARIPGTELRRIVRPVPRSEPLVSLIIATSGRGNLLRRCLDGLLHNTDYRNLELIVMCNISASDDTIALFNELSSNPKVTVVSRPLPFNFPEMCNMGVSRARGAIVGLIDECIQVIEPGWLREMVSHAIRSDVGAVGAMLYYPNDTIRHAGIILGMGTVDGIAAPIYKGLPRGSGGYFGRALLAQNLSCVSAACMVLRREVYVEVGGFDEQLSLDFGDVDLCLRIRNNGYRVVWTPFAELYHAQPASREDADRSNVIAYMCEKWGTAVFDRDPYFNPNLRRDSSSCIAGRPRIAKPWAYARVETSSQPYFPWAVPKAVDGIPRRAMKWYFCINEEAVDKYAEEIDLAVHSCIQNTSLEPHVIFDGGRGYFADRMAELGIAVHFRRTSLAEAIAGLPDGPYDRQVFRHVIARGAFLRYEIPNIEFDEEFVLYTDCDVMFRREFDLEIQPPCVAAGPDTGPDDWWAFNSGVMVLNVPRLRQDYNAMLQLSRQRLGKAPAYDQPILNEFYSQRWTRLPMEYNWRPYWGFNEEAAIVHLHGPKLAVSRQLLGKGGGNVVHDIWRQLFEMNPDAYRRFIAEADRVLAQAEGHPRIRSRGEDAQRTRAAMPDPAIAGRLKRSAARGTGSRPAD